METRKEKFKRLANKRTVDVIDKLRILGNLSNKSSYDYSTDEINKIFRAIEAQLNITKMKFKNTRKVDFQL